MVLIWSAVWNLHDTTEVKSTWYVSFALVILGKHTTICLRSPRQVYIKGVGEDISNEELLYLLRKYGRDGVVYDWETIEGWREKERLDGTVDSPPRTDPPNSECKRAVRVVTGNPDMDLPKDEPLQGNYQPYGFTPRSYYETVPKDLPGFAAYKHAQAKAEAKSKERAGLVLCTVGFLLAMLGQWLLGISQTLGWSISVIAILFIGLPGLMCLLESYWSNSKADFWK
jgi:hypothetical protein